VDLVEILVKVPINTADPRKNSSTGTPLDWAKQLPTCPESQKILSLIEERFSRVQASENVSLRETSKTLNKYIPLSGQPQRIDVEEARGCSRATKVAGRTPHTNQRQPPATAAATQGRTRTRKEVARGIGHVTKTTLLTFPCFSLFSQLCF